MRQQCTFETIKSHQEYLENMYNTLDNEREDKLHSLFAQHLGVTIVSFIKNILEKSLESKKNNNLNRLDNLLLDHMREKATRQIKNSATPKEHQYIELLHEKFMRTLDLELQLEKLERRFLENMPPLSLNMFDKIELHAKGLKSDSVYLSSLREEWKNVLRKTKLDLTSLMRQANKEYVELIKNVSISLREPYET
ncbi:unnamed protein product [Rotaria socialis]|uniref:Uncharacterized protein n=1 Tax=Rotaria socialis TaxID=392032 RepID=A0A818FGK9_9BILA|nr:unnamed protein product [Rotaria socialis]CAF4480880.1 unnamed protein product [Rotaria socialis]